MSAACKQSRKPGDMSKRVKEARLLRRCGWKQREIAIALKSSRRAICYYLSERCKAGK